MAVRRASRAAALTALWRALTRSRRPGEPGLLERLRATPRLAKAALSGSYPGLGRGRLALMAAALLYIVSPVDLVPESMLFLLGLVDDVAVAAWLAAVLLVETDRFLTWELARDHAASRVVTGEVLDNRPA